MREKRKGGGAAKKEAKIGLTASGKLSERGVSKFAFLNLLEEREGYRMKIIKSYTLTT
jgi:hypothetical protein